jgi:2-polyprenyl-3-methyl-5-hydroxy-6-metoxy-1,4-benzoquinol methylase
MNEWELAQEFERSWWGSATNTYMEEVKQLTYAYKMGLTAFADAGRWPVYNLRGRRILDIGGGPVSMLLKCVNYGPASTVVDPCQYPAWVRERYQSVGIGLWPVKAEEFSTQVNFDESWLYNVLQHVEDPERIVANARKAAPVVRIFEWIDMAPCEGHPQMLTEADLNDWLGGEGMTEVLNENGCHGRSFYGVFGA